MEQPNFGANTTEVTQPVAPQADGSSNQGTNSASSVSDNTQTDNTDWKKRYDDSSRGFEKYRSDNEPYVKLGIAFAERYRSDAKFKEFVDSQQGATAEDTSNQGASATEASESTNTQSAAPQDTPELSWARENMTKEMNRRIQVFSQLEGSRSQELDGYNVVQPNGEIYNPMRETIGRLARVYESQGIPFEKAAAMAFTRIVEPEKAVDEAKLDGLVEGLTSASISTIGGFKSSSKGVNDYAPDAEDLDVYRRQGIDVNSPIFKKVVGNA